MNASNLGPAGITHGTADVNGIRMGYLRGGTGRKTLVLVHGWPQSSNAWRWVIEPLAARYTVVAVDLRGVGSSSVPAEGYDKETLARDVHALVEHLGLGDVFVVGHDLGAMVAYAYARLFPDETLGAGIVEMPLPGVAGWDLAAASPGTWHFGFHQGLHHGAGVAEALVTGREAYEAIVVGLGRTGRLVTSAALILVLAFVALGAGPNTELKIFATALAVGIALDATVVRALLVPALVSLFGRLNWWWPGDRGRRGVKGR